jgi:hypothetical protein
MPKRNSLLIFFVAGAILLVIPLILVLFWNGAACGFGDRLSVLSNNYCLSPRLLKSFTSLFPFLMVIGAVLIGFNLKRISDSYLPPDEESKEDNTEIGET